MNFRQMEYFIEVIKANGLTRAAENLYVSQSSISQMIKTLEDELGVCLLDRDNKRIKLTYAGRRFLALAQGVLRSRQMFLNEISDLNGTDSGEIALGISARRAQHMLPLILPRFVHQYPNVKLNITDRRNGIVEWEKSLQDGTYDLVIASFVNYDYNNEYVFLCDEYLCFIVGKTSSAAERLFGKDGPIPERITLDKLVTEELILTYHGYTARLWVDKLFSSAGLVPKIAMEIHSSDLARSLAGTGMYCTITSETEITKLLNPPEYENYYTIPIDHAEARRSISIAYNKSFYLSACHKAFINMAVNIFGGIDS